MIAALSDDAFTLKFEQEKHHESNLQNLFERALTGETDAIFKLGTIALQENQSGFAKVFFSFVNQDSYK